MAAPLLELKGVSKAFGGLHVNVDLDLVVGEGEIVSLIGPNGAGKTTVFNLITGLYRPDKGEISLGGESLLGLSAHRITRRGVARTFQTLRLFLNMSVKENVMAAAYGHTRAGVVRRSSSPSCGFRARAARSGRSTASPRRSSRSSATG